MICRVCDFERPDGNFNCRNEVRGGSVKIDRATWELVSFTAFMRYICFHCYYMTGLITVVLIAMIVRCVAFFRLIEIIVFFM